MLYSHWALCYCTDHHPKLNLFTIRVQISVFFYFYFFFFNNFINYKLHSAQCVPIHSNKKHPILYLVMTLLYPLFWKVKCTLVAERENGFLLGPGLKVCHVHSTPLMGATLYFILFYFTLLLICVLGWCTGICMQAWMSVWAVIM